MERRGGGGGRCRPRASPRWGPRSSPARLGQLAPSPAVSPNHERAGDADVAIGQVGDEPHGHSPPPAQGASPVPRTEPPPPAHVPAAAGGDAGARRVAEAAVRRRYLAHHRLPLLPGRRYGSVDSAANDAESASASSRRTSRQPSLESRRSLDLSDRWVASSSRAVCRRRVLWSLLAAAVRPTPVPARAASRPAVGSPQHGSSLGMLRGGGEEERGGGVFSPLLLLCRSRRWGCARVGAQRSGPHRGAGAGATGTRGPPASPTAPHAAAARQAKPPRILGPRDSPRAPPRARVRPGFQA